jgi:hypothetical protein
MGIGHHPSPFFIPPFWTYLNPRKFGNFCGVCEKEVLGTMESRGIRFSLLTLGSHLMTHALVMRGKLVEICLSSFSWDGWMNE